MPINTIPFQQANGKLWTTGQMEEMKSQGQRDSETREQWSGRDEHQGQTDQADENRERSEEIERLKKQQE